jgi:hypothetical protein
MKQKTMADFITGLSLNTNSFKATMTTAPSNSNFAAEKRHG